ncbi:MAG: NAD-dependent epimerase/dehydratase family protein [Oscillospiraceae bacterium]|nr:NAD-dependent epimerase/dehydratase family protein [Oscillospiraceae bacterium]
MGKVLITGITGYIGSRLARKLCLENEVYGLVRQPLNTTYLSEDLRRRIRLIPYCGTGESIAAALERVQPGMVYHLAAHYTNGHSFEDAGRLLESNLAYGVNLLEAMDQTGCRRLVYATTITTHAAGVEFQPLTLYAAMKQAFSDLTAYYTGRDRLHAAAVALADTYGPGDRRPKVLNLVRQAILEGTSLDLTSGRQIYDAVYIGDVVKGFIKAAEALDDAPHSYFQLSSREPLSLRETVERLLALNGLTLRANWGGRPRTDALTAEKLELYPAPPGWRQEVPLEEGLRRFWADAPRFAQ